MFLMGLMRLIFSQQIAVWFAGQIRQKASQKTLCRCTGDDSFTELAARSGAASNRRSRYHCSYPALEWFHDVAVAGKL
jgi:hypothetical protein